MMQTIRICVLMAIGAVLASCSTSSERDTIAFPEQRPSDFTLGVVVFGDLESTEPAIRSARYIIEPDGTLRASFGEGSDGLTYPPITRRVDDSTLDAIWDRVRSMDLEGDDWRFVQAPEQFHAEMGSNRGYLLEVRSEVSFSAWSTGMDTPSMRLLTRELASLAWVKD
jgi:hypothetical protein